MSASIFLTTLHSIFFAFYYFITKFVACYLNIYEFYSIFFIQLLIHVILLTSTVDVFVLLRTRAIYSVMRTLYPEAIEAYEVLHTFCILSGNMFSHIFE